MLTAFHSAIHRLISSIAFSATYLPRKLRTIPQFEHVALREGEDDGEAPGRRQHPVRPRRGAAHRERLQDRQESERGKEWDVCDIMV